MMKRSENTLETWSRTCTVYHRYLRIFSTVGDTNKIPAISCWVQQHSEQYMFIHVNVRKMDPA